MENNTKSHWKLNLAMLWLSQILVMAGYTAMVPFIPLFIKNELGIFETAALAKYVSAFNFFGTMAYAIFCPIWGSLGDRFGIKPMLLRGTFVTAPIFGLMAYAKSPAMLIFLRFLTAACAGTTAASQIMIARTTPDDKQGFALGVLSTATWGGSVLGNVIGGLLIHNYSFRHAFWFCCILYFIAGFSIIFTHDDMVRAKAAPKELSTRRRILPDFSHTVWIILSLFFVMGLIRNVEIPYIALRIEELTSTEEAAYLTGVISAIVCAGAILSGIINGYLADKLSAKRLLLPIFLVSSFALFFQGWGGIVVFAIARTVLFLMAGGIQPIIQKSLSAVTPKEKRGSAFGLSSLASNTGNMISAVIGGYCFTYFHTNGVFFTASAFFLLALPLFLVGIGKCTKKRA
ncbi:MAG: MFS transporter [Victivallales bacterium]|nr:MFS transporter [Victivallales bacterium]